jgi:5-hydroxyisourate hydrolase
MSTLSTHVLDTALGKPAAGIRITLLQGDTVHGTAVTDSDGRAKGFAKNPLEAGEYRLHFEVHPYFRQTDRDAFYRSITIDFVVRGSGEHYHVPLLVSPFGYSTYRGS